MAAKMEMNIKDRILSIAGNAASSLGILKLYGGVKILAQAQVPILLYHRVGDPIYPWSFASISVSDFKAEMEYLSNNYEIIDLQTLIQCSQQMRSFPRRAAAITFDDGYKDNYVNAFPILQKYHLPATIFLTTGPLDSRELFWWDKLRYIIWHIQANEINFDGVRTFYLNSKAARLKAVVDMENKLKQMSDESKNRVIQQLSSLYKIEIPPNLGKELVLSWVEVKEMKSNGVNFGAHTVTHPILTKIPIEKARWEIEESKKRIEAEIGSPVSLFAYPNGYLTDYSDGIKTLLKNAGFGCALTANPPKPIVSQDDLFQLNRIGASSNCNIFKLSLELFPDIRGLKDKR